MSTFNFTVRSNITELLFSRKKFDQYKLTIIIPSFNRQYQLIKSIQSLNNVIPSDEIIVLVCDNFSDNYDSELINQYLSSTLLDYLYYRNNNNIGAIGNFNNSVLLSPSEFVMFLFDDDLLSFEINKALEMVNKDTVGIYNFHNFKLSTNKIISIKKYVSVFF